MEFTSANLRDHPGDSPLDADRFRRSAVDRFAVARSDVDRLVPGGVGQGKLEGRTEAFGVGYPRVDGRRHCRRSF
jgi:hypothetical protein